MVPFIRFMSCSRSLSRVFLSAELAFNSSVLVQRAPASSTNSFCATANGLSSAGGAPAGLAFGGAELAG